MACGNFPGTWAQTHVPALAGGFLTTRPPEKSPHPTFWRLRIHIEYAVRCFQLKHPLEVIGLGSLTMLVHRKFTVSSSFYDQHYAFPNSHLPREDRGSYSFMFLNPHSGFNLENLSAFLGLWKHKASGHRERYYARFLWQRGWQAGREGGIWNLKLFHSWSHFSSCSKNLSFLCHMPSSSFLSTFFFKWIY